MTRQVTLEDTPQITEIYNHYVLHSIVTFQETVIEVGKMQQKIQTISSKFPWIVYEEEGEILGYAYANEWKSRGAYRHSVESTVYLKQDKTNKGIGSLLYGELIQQLVNTNLHVIIGGIALPNAPSIRLHEKFGFEKVAHFKEVGYKFNQWIDVGYWQLTTHENRT